MLSEDKRSGSVQVVEFSWVFPVAAVTVVALLYLSFLLFFYVYSFHLTELTADTAVQESQTGSVLESATGKNTGRAEAELQKNVRRISFLPGVHYTASLDTKGSIEAKITCTYLGKELFQVRSVRSGDSPVKIAKALDLQSFLKRSGAV